MYASDIPFMTVLDSRDAWETGPLHLSSHGLRVRLGVYTYLECRPVSSPPSSSCHLFMSRGRRVANLTPPSSWLLSLFRHPIYVREWVFSVSAMAHCLFQWLHQRWEGSFKIRFYHALLVFVLLGSSRKFCEDREEQYHGWPGPLSSPWLVRT